MSSDHDWMLENFLEAYWGRESGLIEKSLPQIVSCYRRESRRDQHREMARVIDAYMEQHRADLEPAFKRDFGPVVDPASWGCTAVAFLADIRRLLIEDGETMPAERYPQMGLIFGVYFGQDFDLFGNTVQEVVSSYRNDCPEYRNLPVELDSFTAEHPHDLDAAFERDFGSDFDPELWGYTTASFFNELKRLLLD